MTILEFCKHPLVEYADAESSHKQSREFQYVEGERCILCNKGINKPKLWIHLCNGGSELAHAEDSATVEHYHDAGDLGCHPIGPECKHKLAKVIKKQGCDPKDYITVEN